jgi:segregation and condensation protein B
MSVNPQQLKNILEAAMLAAGEPLSVERMLALFPEEARPASGEVRQALQELGEDCAERGVELKEVSSGFRLQVKRDLAPWVSRLYEERAPRYSRALLETLVLIAYRQPITRGEIEDIRGVTVSTNIIKTLQEREWIRVVGHREVPGKPALYGTTREFLDYFNLKSLGELPSLAEIRSLEVIAGDLGEIFAPAAHEAADVESDSETPEHVVENRAETEQRDAPHTVH